MNPTRERKDVKTSLAYVAVAFLSRFWLHEQISLPRWAGIGLITAV